MNDANAIRLLVDVVSTPSLSGQERAVAEVLRDRAADAGLNSTIDDAGNFVASTSGDPLWPAPGVRDIVLLGHMDTVPGAVPVRTEGDLFFGRGSVDAKGPLAAFVAAVARVRDRLPSGVRLVVIGAVEEETPTSKGANAVAKRYTPAACVIGEPSGWDAATIGYKGRLVVTASAERTLSHTAGPDLSSPDRVVAWWSGVLKNVSRINAGRTGAFKALQASLRELTTHSDGLVERATATAGFRLPPDLSPDDIEQFCRIPAEVVEGQVTIRCVGREVCWQSDTRDLVARAITTAVRHATGHTVRPRLLLKTGTSDMNVVGPVWQCPIAAYGPGDSSLDHTPNEHVSLSEYTRAIGVLESALVSLAAEFAPPHAPVELASATTRR